MTVGWMKVLAAKMVVDLRHLSKDVFGIELLTIFMKFSEKIILNLWDMKRDLYT